MSAKLGPPHYVQGKFKDPLSNKVKKTTENLAADHIFPKKLIKELDGYRKLPKEQKSAVLNNLDNFQGLPKSFNSSKGSKVDWDTFKGDPLNPKYAQELQALQAKLKTKLQKQINGFLNE